MRWPMVAVGDVAEVVSGATPKSKVAEYWGDDVRWATPTDLSKNEGAYLGETARRITYAGLSSCAAQLLPPRSVLMSSRAPIGLVAINTEPMATNQGFKSLMPDRAKVFEGYLYHWLAANTAYLQSLGNGATFKEVSKAVVQRIEIPLPPLDEQRRIAGILDAADALRRRRREALALLDTLPGAIFAEMFEDLLYGKGRNAEPTPLSDVAYIQSGITKGRKLKPGDETAETPYLAVANVQDKRLALENVKTIEATEKERERYALAIGDLLLTEGGDPDKLGRGTIWNEEIPGAIHQNHIFRVRVTDASVQPVFLSHLLSSPYGRGYFLRMAKQTTGIASINKTQLSAFPAILPERERQIEFVDWLTSFENAKGPIIRHLADLESLFASLQARAFAGEL